MSVVNKHGLNRTIPATVKREVRQRSNFGCVMCRRGFYQYEHIDPQFESATVHEAENICCLCGSCHDSVTRGHISKKLVKNAYESIQNKSIDEVGHPIGPLDFHTGDVELFIGGLVYKPGVRTLLRYHGFDLIQILPGEDGEPGRVSAVFTDDQGNIIMGLRENEWIGAMDNWDIEIVGKRITVRKRHGHISLQLRLEPPGRIVVERLDMRIRTGHILVTEETYAVGRYIENNEIYWFHAKIEIKASTAFGAAIEFTDSESLVMRDLFFQHIGQSMASKNRDILLHSNVGVMYKPLGVVIASLCNGFNLYEFSFGVRDLSEMRRIIIDNPNALVKFVGTGSI